VLLRASTSRHRQKGIDDDVDRVRREDDPTAARLSGTVVPPA
jgi:hypothetical protein